MGQSVAVCVDSPQVLGAASCTAMVWVDSETLSVSSGLGLTVEEADTFLGSAVLLLAIAYGVRQVVRIFK